METTPEFGFSLSGGGARGVVQLGIMQALYEAGIRPTIIAGTSMGAINGLFLAAGYTPKETYEILLKNFDRKAIPYWRGVRKGFQNLIQIFQKYIDVTCFEDLDIPLYVSATNLNTGKNELASQGNLLFDYVIASASIPIIFPPRIINKHHYVDGGASNNFPTRVLVGKCDKIIGIHVNHIAEMNDFRNMFAIVERIYRIAIHSAIADRFDLCDFCIDPEEIMKYSMFDFDKMTEIYKLGYRLGKDFLSKNKQELVNMPIG
ncbi:MAG: patatin-like phospholipase family protein [Bacteroidetes bacterium]|nr:patatin-like phospholipase family protein [Bacteroidota bacterium]